MITITKTEKNDAEYEVVITTNTEVITTTINDITELHDLLLKYDYIGVDVRKRGLVKKKVKEWKN